MDRSRVPPTQLDSDYGSTDYHPLGIARTPFFVPSFSPADAIRHQREQATCLPQTGGAFIFINIFTDIFVGTN